MANMFGALNRFIARLDSEQPQKPSNQGAWGFQVLRNLNLEIAIEPWFDFIIGINGHSIDNPEPTLLAQEISNSAGAAISLGIYSSKGGLVREQYVQVPAGASNLGLTLQWSPLSTTEDVWHILDVTPSSPADHAGLLPYSDYVIGSPTASLKGENGLPELIEAHMGKSLTLYVYNHEYDVTRTLEITPARGWGGEGALGCVLGFGALHRVPAPLTEPTQEVGETLFEMGRFSNEEVRSSPKVGQDGFQSTPPVGQGAFAPASSAPAAPTSMPVVDMSSAPPRGPKKTRAAPKPGAGLDDLFKEGEEQSRELDRSSTPKTRTSLPPPPKGGPPRSTKSPAPNAETPLVEEKEAEKEVD